MNCPLCNSASKQAFIAKDIAVLDCDICGHRFADVNGGESFVADVYGDDYFSGGGAGYTDYAAEGDMLIERGKMYAAKLRKHAAPGSMLDVGAACGFLLKGFIDSGWTGVGIEPNASMSLLAKDKLNVDVITGTLENAQFDRRFDLISMVQVAGHFYDPAQAFRTTHDLLNDGGHLLIETWNRGSLSARVLGRHWHEYSPPSVLQWFSADGLTAFLNELGLEKIDGGRPSKSISGGHARSLLKYRLGDLRLLDLIPEKLMIPYPSEDLLWALYRKSSRETFSPDAA